MRAVRKLDSFVGALCTPIGPGGRPLAADLVLKEHIKNCTRSLAADGASKERLALLSATKQVFPNGAILIRDSAHARRIAGKNI